jgi:serine/threonine-protein kinase
VTAPSPAQQLVGAVLNGRFRLVRLLGEGGMGAVFEADSTRGEGKRAIKLLHQEFVKEEQILARFFAEAQATRTLQHPNVAQVLETGTAENGTPYLVMELLQGIPLSTYTDQPQALPPAQAVNVIYGVLQALGAAHGRSIVHRDLKPDNLFLVTEPSGATNVKVLDFGIAKVMDVAGGMGQKTRTGVLLGTPGYMSPEQVKNSKAVDARSDLWSVAVILYELLTAQSPFPGDNEFARLTSVISEEPKPIDTVAPHLANWAPFFQRALMKEPARRFQTADEMAQALLAAARGQSLRPPPPPTLQGGGPVGDYRASQPSTPYAAILGAGIQQQSGLMPSPASMAAMFGPPSAATPAPPPPQSMTPYPPQVQTPYPPPPSATPYPPSVEGPSGMFPVPALSGPTSRPSATVASAPMPPAAAPAYPANNPAANAAAGIGPTQVSSQRPPGVPTVPGYNAPIEIVDAPRRASGVAWWVVVVVGLVTFGLGLALGLVLH